MLAPVIDAVEEINNNSNLHKLMLPWQITLLAVVAMVTGPSSSCSNSKCGSVPTEPVIVDGAQASSAIVVANTFGVFDIPMVRMYDVLQV